MNEPDEYTALHFALIAIIVIILYVALVLML